MANRALLLQKAVFKMFKMNYRPIVLQLQITPEIVTWEYALQFKTDQKLNWHPSIVKYHRKNDTISIHAGYNDPNVTYVNAETILTLADGNIQPPKQGA